MGWVYALRKIVFMSSQETVCLFQNCEDAENAAWWMNYHNALGPKTIYAVELTRVI